MPLIIKTGGMSARGFGFTTSPYFNFRSTISSNISTYNLYSAVIAAGWNGVTPINAIITINSGVVVSGTGTGSSSAILLSNLSEKSIVTINNSGTIAGSGGAAGSNGSGAGTSPYPGNPTSVTPITFSTGYNSTGYPTGYGAGGSTPGYNYYSGGGAPGGTAGSVGGSAIYLSSNAQLIINNASSGIIVGGGGGGGGQAGNNAGGGSGGNGGYLIQETGSHPIAIANNISGGILASGGGGTGGWGNRYENDGIGGRPGYPGTNWPSGLGNYGGNGISSGLATNNTSNTLINTTGTFTLSPAV
jgi:hypothetical protein